MSYLIGAELDAAVAHAQGWKLRKDMSHDKLAWVLTLPDEWQQFMAWDGYSPSTDWSQGGPIIERERITIVAHKEYDGEQWSACVGEFTHYIDEGCPFGHTGPTPLIAAMRAFVASKT